MGGLGSRVYLNCDLNCENGSFGVGLVWGGFGLGREGEGEGRAKGMGGFGPKEETKRCTVGSEGILRMRYGAMREV